MMITHGDHTATGVLLKGVDPEQMPKVLDLPRHIGRHVLLAGMLTTAKPVHTVRDEPMEFVRWDTPAQAMVGIHARDVPSSGSAIIVSPVQPARLRVSTRSAPANAQVRPVTR